MAKPVYVRPLGNWIEASAFVNVSGVWREVKEGFIFDGSVWRRAYGYWRATITVGSSGSFSGYDAGSYGSISDDKVMDAAGVQRTIDNIRWSASLVLLRFTGRVDEPEHAFHRMVVNGVEFLRSAATDPNNDQDWNWSNPGLGTIGATVDVELHWE